jgi:hypothetical protein
VGDPDPAGVPPPDAPVTLRSSDIQLPSMRNIYRSTVLLLDGGVLLMQAFENCRVRFTDTPTQLVGVVFKNCVFEVPVTSKPTPMIEMAAEQLLAANGIGSVTMSINP